MRNNINDYGWIALPRSLIKDYGPVLGTLGLAVYSLLAAYADEDHYSKLNYRKISRKLGCSNAEAVRALHQLEDIYLIRPEPDSTRKMTYRLLWIPPWENLGKTPENEPDSYRFAISIKKIFDDDIDGIKRLVNTNMDQSKEIQLAYEIAEALNDMDAIQLHISYAHRFPEALLREKLVKVLAVPDHKIRSSRGALFNHLIQQHEAKKKYRPRD